MEDASEFTEQDTAQCRDQLDDLREWKRVMTKHAEEAKVKVTLNVGGELFYTTKMTLLAHEDTFFFHMLSSGAWQPDEAGEYFIDRNPHYFKFILEFLRGQLDHTLLEELEDLPPDGLRNLMCEVDFYQVNTLRDILQRGNWFLRRVHSNAHPQLCSHHRILEVIKESGQHCRMAVSSVPFDGTFSWEVLLVAFRHPCKVKLGVINRLPSADKPISKQPETGYTRINLMGEIKQISPGCQPTQFGPFGALRDDEPHPGDKIGFLLQTNHPDAGTSTLTFEYRGQLSAPVPLPGVEPYYAMITSGLHGGQRVPFTVQILRFPAMFKHLALHP